MKFHDPCNPDKPTGALAQPGRTRFSFKRPDSEIHLPNLLLKK